jgi:hypothetical protein
MNLFKSFLKKNWLLFFCLIIIVLQFAQIGYFKRAVFLQSYDANYWKDRFEHSQYTLPLSQRIIGDDGLYSYAGYRLIHGASIESTISDKPPVGIYIAGLSTLIFNNPLWGELLLGIGATICFFLLTLELLKDKKTALMATTLFALEPFISSFFSITLLDLPQLFFLLLHLIFLLYAVKNKRFGILLALISGLSLGLFAETKPPLLLPVIILLETLYLYKQKSLLSLVSIGIGFLFGAVIPYFRYFQTGHSLIDYLKLHKYMASIYLAGHNRLFPLAIWQSLLIGYSPNVVTGQLLKMNNWWPFLPLVTAVGFYQTLKVLFQKKFPLFLKGLAIFFLTVLLIYTLVPSYARYLVLVIPFLYIFTALFLKKYAAKPIFLTIFIIVAAAGLLYSSFSLLPSADNVLQGFKYNFTHQFFQDIYQEDISASDRLIYSEQQFRELNQKALTNASIVDVNFKELSRSIPYLGKAGQVKYLVTYTTRDLGKFSEEKTVLLTNDQGEWKIDWNWNLLLNSFKPGDKFILNINLGKRGTIYDNNGKVLIQDSNSLLIKINPEKIDTKREMKTLILLSTLTAQEKMHLQNAYLENPLPNTYVDIATPFIQLTNRQQAELESYPGIELIAYNSRLYSQMPKILPVENTNYTECCTRIYSSSNYHGIDGIEKKYDKQLSGQNGGTLTLTDKNGALIKTLISRQPKNGTDIVIH